MPIMNLSDNAMYSQIKCMQSVHITTQHHYKLKQTAIMTYNMNNTSVNHEDCFRDDL